MLTTWTVEDGRCRVREGAMSDITAELAHPGRHTVPCRDVEDILARIGRRAACRAVGGIADRRLSVRTRLPQIVERDLPAQPVEAGGIDAGVG